MNLAIIGCGERGALLAESAIRAGLTVSLCADTSERRARALAKRIEAEATTRCKTVPGRKSVEAVAIASPTDSHAQYIAACAKAGKHVLCASPFVRTSSEVRESGAAVRKAGIVCVVTDEPSLRPERVAIGAQVDAGKIGRVGSLRIHQSEAMPKGAENWYRDYPRSGGVAFEGLVDEYGWIASTFGSVKKVFCQTLQRPALDYAMVTLTLESGIIAQVIGSWAEPKGRPIRHRIEVCGTEGMIQFDSAESSIGVTVRSGSKPAQTSSNPTTEGSMDRHVGAFLRAVSRGKKFGDSLGAATTAIRIAEAAVQSATTGKAVRP